MRQNTPLGDILVVDDNADNIRLLESVLVERGYRVRAALNGTAALSVVEASPPQLILLDICMPEPDGYSVCERLKSVPTHRDIPVIFLSGLLDANARARAFRSGAADYLIKPFDTEELLGRVHTHFNQRKLHDQLRNQTRQALQANDMKSRFMAAAGHDLRQPLAAMRLLSEALQNEVFALTEADDKPTSSLEFKPPDSGDAPCEPCRFEHHRCLPDPARIQHLSNSIARTLDNLQSLVDNLLDASALDSGAVKPDRLWFPVRDLITSIERDLLPLANERELGWSCLCCDGCIYSDPILLERIVRKLLDNALKYTLHGTVGLRASMVGNNVELTISDTGAGISTRQRREMFEDFRPIDTVSPKRGLGLSIVQRLCHLLDHSLHIDSRPGLGTTVTVTITESSLKPVTGLAQPPTSLDIAPPGKEKIPAQSRVLLIDTHSTLGDEAFALLVEWGYDVQRMSPAEYQIACLSMPLQLDLLVTVSDDANTQALHSMQGRPGSEHATKPLILLGNKQGLIFAQAERDKVLYLREPLKPAQLRSAIRACLRAM